MSYLNSKYGLQIIRFPEEKEIIKKELVPEEVEVKMIPIFYKKEKEEEKKETKIHNGLDKINFDEIQKQMTEKYGMKDYQQKVKEMEEYLRMKYKMQKELDLMETMKIKSMIYGLNYGYNEFKMLT